MNNPVEHALGFVRGFAVLAERLAGRDIVVRNLHCNWSAFGSWTVEASSGDGERKRSSAIRRHELNEPGPEVLRVTWDGRERQLSMDATPTGVSTMSNRWRHLDTHSCDSAEAALALAEEWLCSRLGSGQS
jgi:hypothetical protein